MKKLVALVLAVVILSALIATAVAADCGSHTYIWEKVESAWYWGKYDDTWHCKVYMYIQVCTKCGCTGATKYIAPSAETLQDADKRYHQYSGNVVSSHNAGTTTHTFYKKCDICQKGYGEAKTIDCPGGNAHVTYTFP